jgi:membrane protein DedA with SNARE-associated domain
MTVEQAFAHYGPVVVFLGAAFEGNLAVIAGGLLAHQKLAPLWVMGLAATAGSWLIDQCLFLAGRRFRDNRFVQRVCQTKAFSKSLAFIERYPTSFILAFRFIYGVRMAGPVALGVTRVSALRFFVLNFVGAMIWAATFTLAGFFFGEAIEALFGQIKAFERYIAWAIAAGVVVFAGYHLARYLTGKRLGPD